jgi:hypothetical protein
MFALALLSAREVGKTEVGRRRSSMTAEEQARALVREAKAERPLSLPWVDSVVDAYVWRFGPGATAERQRDLLIALQELADQLDPLQLAVLKGRIAVF